jgi:hypothetical protein
VKPPKYFDGKAKHRPKDKGPQKQRRKDHRKDLWDKGEGLFLYGGGSLQNTYHQAHGHGGNKYREGCPQYGPGSLMEKSGKRPIHIFVPLN